MYVSTYIAVKGVKHALARGKGWVRGGEGRGEELREGGGSCFNGTPAVSQVSQSEETVLLFTNPTKCPNEFTLRGVWKQDKWGAAKERTRKKNNKRKNKERKGRDLYPFFPHFGLLLSSCRFARVRFDIFSFLLCPLSNN